MQRTHPSDNHHVMVELASSGPSDRIGTHSGESAEHRTLKHTCAQWLSSRGYRCVATEVRCPISRYRIDVAGYASTRGDSSDRGIASVAPASTSPGDAHSSNNLEPGRSLGTVIVECKVSRTDFLRNAGDLDDLVAQRARLEADRLLIEQRILKTSDPDALCLSDSLFPDLESWDFARCRNRSYRAVLSQLRLIHRELYGRTKFHRAARYALADTLLIAAPTGLLRSQEIPEGWGLIEFAPAETAAPTQAESTSREAFQGPRWHAQPVRFRPASTPPRPSRGEMRHRLLTNIAIAATRHAPWWPPHSQPSPTPDSPAKPENSIEPAGNPTDTISSP